MLAGLVREPLFVMEMDLFPAEAGVYVNVLVGDELVRLIVVGEKVPPPVTAGVTVTVPEMVPLAPTVKLVEAALTRPEVGPVKERAVALEEDVKFALQLALAPPPVPTHDQVKGPLPETRDAVPAVQRSVLGAEVKVWLLDEPQAPAVPEEFEDPPPPPPPLLFFTGIVKEAIEVPPSPLQLMLYVVVVARRGVVKVPAFLVLPQVVMQLVAVGADQVSLVVFRGLTVAGLARKLILGRAKVGLVGLVGL